MFREGGLAHAGLAVEEDGRRLSGEHLLGTCAQGAQRLFSADESRGLRVDANGRLSRRIAEGSEELR